MTTDPRHLTVCDGKYTLVMDPGALRALRYGEPWRDLVGDGFVMALGHEIEALRDDAAAVDAALDRACVVTHTGPDQGDSGPVVKLSRAERVDALAAANGRLARLGRIVERERDELAERMIDQGEHAAKESVEVYADALREIVEALAPLRVRMTPITDLDTRLRKAVEVAKGLVG